MTKTKQDFITELKSEYPTLTKGVDDRIIALSSDEYLATIDLWAEDRLQMQSKEAAEKQAVIDKSALLTKMGLTADEAKLLLI